jgi:transcription-repair coupling factor (superfamily II helicase)
MVGERPGGLANAGRLAKLAAVPSPAPHDWLDAPLDDPAFARRLGHTHRGEGPVVFDHVEPAAWAWLTAAILRHRPRATRVWILLDGPKQRDRLAAELGLWDRRATALPDPPMRISEDEVADPETVARRLEVLALADRASRLLVLTAPDAFNRPAPTPKSLTSRRIALRRGESRDPESLIADLAAQGFERQPLVQARGQFAVRGGILDVFPWQSEHPLRIEFFDTDIDSIRAFNLDSQTTLEKLERADLLLGEPDDDGRVGDYRRPDDLVIAIGDLGDDDPGADVRIVEGPARDDVEEDFSTACFGRPLGQFEAGDFILHESRRQRFFQQLAEWRADGWRVGLVFANRGERERFEELLPEIAGDAAPPALTGDLMESFSVPAAKLALVSSAEVFGRYRTPGTARRDRRAAIATARASLDEIQPGDLVVHSEYGIGRFKDIATNDDGEEHIHLEYRDGAILEVPIDQAHLVGRYVGLGGRRPQLSKLGGNAWRNTRGKAAESILDYAARLLRIQAERDTAEGFAHPPDSRWMWEFEHSFHFTETADQLAAIEATKRDMESPKPMDRLICGDVGFGKTEVALRAAFKAVTGGKQVVLLCPTTVLAEQHWRTFRERMSDYPVRVELLNRFRSAAEARATIEGLASGAVDIVIGTHRLISADIAFKDLGLAVIDEEQRFGVQHKERFKEIFRRIDMLTLSATPIPRTLYMALMGARDMSTIDTPPPNRVPVETSVTPYDERLIRDAIRREIHRGGQVFFLHNRVKSIESVCKTLAKLVPEARLLVGHGQMEKDELELVMRAFVHGEADVLLATTIIETGIDIPNANTILIDRADRFGLADLYQLRGRVGRAGEKAYALLLLPRDLTTQGDARKRIHAIREYTALGSGFKIAMRDLEIRGAGNLLGTKQSGQIAAVGFDLYCQLLRHSVDRLRGKTPKQKTDATFRSDFTAFSAAEHARADGSVLPCYLPHDWLAETPLRVAAYRQLAECADPGTLRSLADDWADRFGRVPEPAANLLEVTRLRLIAGDRGVQSIEIKGQRLMLQRNGDYIMFEGRRFPRLKATGPAAKLREAGELLESL